VVVAHAQNIIQSLSSLDDRLSALRRGLGQHIRRFLP
jgi:hypothetical protein